MNVRNNANIDNQKAARGGLKSYRVGTISSQYPSGSEIK